MNEILCDASKFRPLNTDLFKCLLSKENKLIAILRKMLKNKSISDSTYKSLYPSGSQPGVLYGLPKVHKDGVPMRPILSALNTFNYNLSKYLVPIIEPVTSSPYSVKDSFHFLKEISDLTVDGCVMASFDVTSLFTSIPLDETIDLVTSELSKVPGFNEESFLGGNFRDLLGLAVKDCVFLFDGKAYIQIDGVAMGSPLGPTLANAFMSIHEQKWLENCPPQFKPLFYRRYIDDTFVVFKSSEHVDKFLSFINNQHRCISFTCEREVNNSLPFLDILISRKGPQLCTTLYRKPTFTGLGMKFESCLPLSYKLNLVQTLVHRAYRICSDYLSFHKEIEFLTNYFVNNGYPVGVVQRMVGKTLTKLLSPEGIPTAESSERIVTGSFEFLGKQSITFKHKLNRLVQEYFKNVKVRVAFRAARTLGSSFPYKDQIPWAVRSGVVYQYSCGCCNASYIGQTSRHLQTRMAEHRAVGPTTDRPVTPKYSAIREHSEDNQHPIAKDGFRILGRAVGSDLPILETLYTHVLKPTLTKNVQSVELVTL